MIKIESRVLGPVATNCYLIINLDNNESIIVDPADSPEWLEVLDQGVLNVVFSLFAGKAYAIFALLFGFTFYTLIPQHYYKIFFLST